jgi:hypothetical protein
MSDPAASGKPGPGAPAATEVHVDRIRLQVAGLDEGAARRLARLVAEGLVPGVSLSPAAGSLESLRIEVPSGAGDSPDALAQRITDRIGRALAQGRAGSGWEHP